MMLSSTVLPSTSSSNLLEREYLIRTKLSRGNLRDYDQIIALRIFDDFNHASEEILLDEIQRENHHSRTIDVFHIRTKEKLNDFIRRLKLHTKSEHKDQRIFLRWIELTDLTNKHTFCFPVEDYLPSSSGDALELTEVHQDTKCEGNDEQIKSMDNSGKYAKLYDVRTKTGPKGFLGIQSSMKANVYLRLFDKNNQISEEIPLMNSRLHQQPFRSNQTDQFEIETKKNLGALDKVEMWHDGKKNTRFYCDTLEITDQSNGQIYCFQIKEHLENDQKLILTDYDNRRCLKTHDHTTRTALTDENTPMKSEFLPSKLENSSTTTDSNGSSNTNLNQTLFKIRTRVGHKGFLSLGMGGTDARVYLRVHQGETISDEIPLNNSLTHQNSFEAGHTDIFERNLPENFTSPDRLEVYHTGKKHDGLYLKWIELMNMKTLERKCFPVNRWLDLDEGDRKTHLILSNYTLNESCEENEYHQRHSHDRYQTEYLIRTKTSSQQTTSKNSNEISPNIFLKIYNNKKKHTEEMLLNHSKPFRPGKIDHFEVGSAELMDDEIDKIELWDENKSQCNWLCQWIEIKNKKTGSVRCFAVNRPLSGKIVLTIHSNHSCDHVEHELHDLAKNHPTSLKNSSLVHYHSPNREDYTKKYIIQTQTGKQMLSGTNARVFVRLFDDQNEQSEEILLEQSVTKKIPFEKHALDEFHTGTWKNLSDLKKIHLWFTGEKHQGWNVEFIQIEDLDKQRIYCFPVNKRLDSNSTFTELTEFNVDQPCTLKSNENVQRTMLNDDQQQQQENLPQMKRSYHVETKTGKRGFLGLSPTGTNAKVYIRIHDRNGEISERIELSKSTNHTNKFERGQTDHFDVGSVRSLDGIDKLEVWHDDTGMGRGWFADYISIIDNQTGEESCFFIGQYLNNEYGGVEGKHLILDKQSTNNRPCREHQFEAKESTLQESLPKTNLPSSYAQTYRIETKTGHTGLFGLGAAGTNAPVYIRIHDNQDNTSEAIHLDHSLRHKNKFEKNQTDVFDVGTNQTLDGVKKLELWHEGNQNDGWQVDYVNVVDQQTGHSYCFLVNAMLDLNSGLKKTNILLENPSMNIPCSDQFKAMKKAHGTSLANSPKQEKVERNFSIRTKTGNHIEAGSTTPIHIQLFDDREQVSENIRLKHKDHDKHNFIPGAIDEFEVTSAEPLSDRLIGIRVKHHADKYQGWYAEWIEVTDRDNGRTYCYPIQRWIDKGENDKQTDVYFTDVSDVSCDSLSETMQKTSRRSIPTVRAGMKDVPSPIASQSHASSTVRTQPTQFQNTYHVKTKTGKKGFLGISPTGTNAKVFLRIIDKNGERSERLQLHGSTGHKNKFERGQTDEFDIGTNKPLNSIDQIELWTNDKGLGSGWFPNYIEITDNKTGKVVCFPINQYLNEKNGGIEGNPLVLQKRMDDRPCQQITDEPIDDQSNDTSTVSNVNTPEITNKYKRTYSVVTKTGHGGFLGLGGAGTNAPVFIRIHDTKGQISEGIQLKHSTRHHNKFERNQTDQFDIGTSQSLDGISRMELWHEGDDNAGWQVEYIQIYDNQTNTSYCFPVHSMLDRNSGLKQTHVLLEKPLINVSCANQIEVLKRDRMTTDVSNTKKKKEKYQRNFTIRTKTGNQIEAGSTTPIHIQLFDDADQSSEDIRLKHQENDKHNFKPGAIDEFQVTSEQPLSNQLTGIRVKHHADKYQGWYAEWIEITDEDNGRIYCYPIRRWIDKGENDKKRDLFFTDTSAVPCDSLPDTTMESTRTSIPTNRKTRDFPSQSSISTPAVAFQNTYHVETKTGKKGFLGLSPTGTNADVYIRIIDRDGNKSEPIRLKGSIDHKNKFERNKVDEFDVGSIKSLNGIKQLEIWTDGKGFGHGWYADYIAVTDNQTNEEACFLIGQYLNKEYGGVADNHLLLDKQSDDIPCREKIQDHEEDMDTVQTRQMTAIRPMKIQEEDLSSAIPYKRTYHVDTKTGEKGFWNLSPTGTNADVYLRIHDESGHVSEPICLRRSTKHSNPFEKGKIDSFDIGTKQSLQNIAKLELYHNETGFGHGWNIEHVNILDNLTGHSYCFPADRWLNNAEHMILDRYVLDVPCEEMNNQRAESKIDGKARGKRSFTVRTKTGSQVEAGSTTPIFLRLYDDHSQKSEKLRLQQKTKDNHRFQPGSIDEFPITSDKPLSSISAIEISHNADKYQGWYGEWISITDNDRNETFCFPLQRWLDKGELDGKTQIYLKRIQTTIPCEDLPDTMQRQSLTYRTANNQGKTPMNIEDYPSKYHVQVKTAKKGFLGLAPTGTDANVFMKIYDNDGKTSEAIQLRNSLNHKNKFTRGNLDDFDVGSNEDLNGINQLELWTDGKGLGSGWCPEYLQITDQKTGEINCFAVEQYLNEKYGGTKDDHLILKKRSDNRICDQLKNEELNQLDNQTRQQSSPNSDYRERFQVDIKTGHTGFLGLGGAGTDAPVFIQLYDSNGHKSEIFQLKHSIRHSNKFERNQTDQFLVHTDEPLTDISAVDLWHEGTRNDGWQVDYVNIVDKKSKTSYCFPVNAMLDRNSGLKQTSIHLENPSINAFCKEQAQAMKKTHSYTSISKRHKSNGNYTIQTKTGDHPSAGSTTPIHVQLIDIDEKKSKDIRLKKKDTEGHHFAPGTIDEFKITIPESLSSIKAVKLSVDAEKYQGWYGEWISITDDDRQITYCFPIQRWLDKGEEDRKTHVTLYQQSNIPCQQLSDSTKIISNQDNQIVHEKNFMKNPLVSERNFPFEIRTQTADKSLRSQSEQNVNVYLNIYDKTNQQMTETMKLINSKTHKKSFQRHHTDRFDIVLPNNIKLSEIDRIDLYHDGQNDGWFCDSVELKNIQTNESKCFTVHQWLDQLSDQSHFSITNYRPISCDHQNEKVNLQYYHIRLKTDTTNLPSMNSIKISLKLFGKSHQTDFIPLDQTIDHRSNAFQKNNSIDTFEIQTPIQLNSLEKLQFSYEIFPSDGQISFQWIEIKNLSNGKLFCFPINRRLSTSIDDHHEQTFEQILSLASQCS